MKLQRYRIRNLLSYQISEIQSMLNQDILTLVKNIRLPHFTDIYVGLNDTEASMLMALGYCVTKHIVIGDDVSYGSSFNELS